MREIDKLDKLSEKEVKANLKNTIASKFLQETARDVKGHDQMKL